MLDRGTMGLGRLGSGLASSIARVLSELGGVDAGGEERAVGLLARYLEHVTTWNERTDLTAARSPEELVDLFVADAAFLASRRTRPGSSWADVGSGAGAPGLPLAILRPELVLTLVEPRAKRVAFLRSALGALELDHVRVERKRGEELETHGFDSAVSRATLPPRAWLELGSRLSRGEVWVLLAKGEAPELAGWTIAEDDAYRWPLTGAERRALCFVREGAAP
jgi:16S rRNA (guanine527-N7)-methyltransferase